MKPAVGAPVCIQLRRAPQLRPRFLLPSTSSSHGRWTLRSRTMNLYREKTSMVLTRLLYRFGRRRPTIAPLSDPLGSPGSQTSLSTEESADTSPLSKSLGPPAPQTSLSTNSRISSLNRMITYTICQFSNFQTRLSFPSSLTSPKTRRPLVIALGSVIRIAQGEGAAGTHGSRFYDG